MTAYLVHHGILGQKWGVRRYQNKDGSLTPAGQKRYSKELSKRNNVAAPAFLNNGGIDEGKHNVRQLPAYKDVREKSNALFSCKYMQEQHKYYKDHPEEESTLDDSKFIDWLERKYSPQGAEQLQQECTKLLNEYSNARQKLVNELVGKYGNREVAYKAEQGINFAVERDYYLNKRK